MRYCSTSLVPLTPGPPPPDLALGTLVAATYNRVRNPTASWSPPLRSSIRPRWERSETQNIHLFTLTLFNFLRSDSNTRVPGLWRSPQCEWSLIGDTQRVTGVMCPCSALLYQELTISDILHYLVCQHKLSKTWLLWKAVNTRQDQDSQVTANYV